MEFAVAERIGYAPKEVAQKLGVNVKTIYDAIEEGQIPALRIGKRRLIISQAAFDRMMQEGRNPK
jgi:excisionase family DNA binding protein